MTLRLLCSLLLVVACWGEVPAQAPRSSESVTPSDIAVAKRLAELAKEAYSSGRVVRAYVLFVEASTRDPRLATYRDNRDALEGTAKLLMKAHLETADIAGDIKAAEEQAAKTKAGLIPAADFLADASDSNKLLSNLPHVEASAGRHSFNLRGDQMTLFQQVATTFGVRAVWDPQMARLPDIQFRIDDVDWPTALEALTAVTNTFVFPVSTHAVFFATDSEDKRNEFEPVILLTLPLPEAVTEKDLIEAANGVRAILNLRAFGWDSAGRTVFVRDRVTRARTARLLLESLLVPKAQVSLEVQFLTLDASTTYRYGFSLQTAFQLVNLGHIGNLQQRTPSFGSATKFLTFGVGGGPGALLALGITDASLFATYSKSFATANYDATVIADDQSTATLHVGQKYPIPQSLYTGASQTAGSIYNPVGQIKMEDLGLVLKMTPRVNGNGEINLEVEAEYKTLGSVVLNTVPSINQRKYTGSVSMREGQWAVLAGMDEKSTSADRIGLAGLSSIPGLKHVFSDNTRRSAASDTLVVIKPTITRLPMSPWRSPGYFLGPVRGERVVM